MYRAAICGRDAAMQNTRSVEVHYTHSRGGGLETCMPVFPIPLDPVHSMSSAAYPC